MINVLIPGAGVLRTLVTLDKVAKEGNSSNPPASKGGEVRSGNGTAQIRLWVALARLSWQSSPSFERSVSGVGLKREKPGVVLQLNFPKRRHTGAPKS